MRDLTGLRFNRLVVISFAYRNGSRYFWVCVCDCGKTKTIQSTSFKKGLTKSCGCLQKSIMVKMKSTHGETYTKTYTIWQDVKRRCENPQRRDYKYYGGRGIQNKLISHKDILLAIGPWPGKGYSLDRINNNGHYQKDNIRWATQSEQRRNSRSHAECQRA